MSVLTNDYEQLEERIQLLSENWSHQLEAEALTNADVISGLKQYPIIPQLDLTINLGHYKAFILELIHLLKEQQPSSTDDLNKIESALSDEVLQKWSEEAIVVNTYYFEQFARETEVEEWLGLYLAEHAVRPFLRKISSEIKETLKEIDSCTGCPTCGEPARLAVISKSGKKELTCPRCDFTWEEKKISCAHCKTEEHADLEILTIEGDEKAQIHVCHKCSGYTKVIDVRRMIKKESPQLLDIKTIHLDYIAQENGYGISEGKGTH